MVRNGVVPGKPGTYGVTANGFARDAGGCMSPFFAPSRIPIAN